MPSVRLNWVRALAVLALAAPALAGSATVSSRRELPQRAPVTSPVPTLQVPRAPAPGTWLDVATPRVLRSLPESRQVRPPAPIVLRTAGAVALLDVSPPPPETRRPQGLRALLHVDELPAAAAQRRPPQPRVLGTSATGAPAPELDSND